MESRPLKNVINMVMDIRGMAGPVTRRSIAEEVMRCDLTNKWSASDEYEARIAYIGRAIKSKMRGTHSLDFINRNLSHIPPEYWGTLRQLSRWICISSGGGHGSEHVMTLVATKAHWQANFKLKDHIVNLTRASRDNSREVRDLLERTGAGCLADLLCSEAAA